MAHQYPLVKPIVIENNVRMLSLEDIGAMKLHAIVESGERLKDFVDMYVLLERQSLKTYLQAYEDKYGLIGKIGPKDALLYHKEIDFNLPVTMTEGSLRWKSVVKRLREAAAEPAKIFISAKQTSSSPSESETKKSEQLRQLPKSKTQKNRRRPKL
jgi:Nucleotidyl transferase AbiEii toxin, Type IV TA system